jgi:hypothetical protein
LRTFGVAGHGKCGGLSEAGLGSHP